MDAAQDDDPEPGRVCADLSDLGREPLFNTGRHSDNALYHALKARGVSVETIGDATAPRGTYEAVYEGHRAGRAV